MYFTSFANLKCTPADRQMYPQGYMYPRLGTSGLDEPTPGMSSLVDSLGEQQPTALRVY